MKKKEKGKEIEKKKKGKSFWKEFFFVVVRQANRERPMSKSTIGVQAVHDGSPNWPFRMQCHVC